MNLEELYNEFGAMADPDKSPHEIISTHGKCLFTTKIEDDVSLEA